MNNENLVRMANQIGHFFESFPDRQEGLEQIAVHIKKFWDPRMRKALIEFLESSDNTGLSDIVREAIDLHRSLLA